MGGCMVARADVTLATDVPHAHGGADGPGAPCRGRFPARGDVLESGDFEMAVEFAGTVTSPRSA